MPRKPRVVTQSRRAYLEDAIVQHERQAEKAEEAQSFGAAVAAKKAAEVVRSELDQLLAAEKAVRAMSDDPVSELWGVVADVRRMRVAATEAGSYVAATKLIQSEADILAKMAADAVPTAELEGDALVAAAVTELRSLPPHLLARILEGLDE